MARPSRYPLELRRRAVRMVAEVRDGHPNERAALQVVTEKLSIGSREMLRSWVSDRVLRALIADESDAQPAASPADMRLPAVA